MELTNSQIYNHLDGINCIATKTGMFLLLKAFYNSKLQNVFEYLPDTFILDM